MSGTTTANDFPCEGLVPVGAADGSVSAWVRIRATGRPGEERVRRALEASEHLSGGVRGPFHIEAVGGTTKPTSEAV